MATELFSLVATLGLDASPFTSGIAGAWNTLTTFVGDVYKQGMAFDEAVASIKALSNGSDDLEEKMGQLRPFMLELAKGSVFTADEVANAAYYMKMAGWDVDEIMAGLPGVISLAAASGEDLAMVSDIVTDSMTAFGQEAGEASNYADVLAATAANANTDVHRMGETFKYVAPVAGSLGYAYQDVAVAIGLIASQGIKGSQAGTSLRNILTRLATDGGATAEKIGALGVLTNALGVEFFDASGNARPFIDVLTEARAAWNKGDFDPEVIKSVGEAFGETVNSAEDARSVIESFENELHELNITDDHDAEIELLSRYEEVFTSLGVETRTASGELKHYGSIVEDAENKLTGLNSEDQIYYANTIGNLRGMTAWLAMMNASQDDFDQLTGSINNSADAAQRMADARLDSLGGDIDMLQSKLNIMSVAIYDDTKEDARTIFKELGTSVDNITAAIQTAGENGGDALIAGIEQAGIEVDRLLGILDPILTPLFTRIGTLLSTAFTTAIEVLMGNGDLIPKIVNWGVMLGEGLITGLLHAIAVGADDGTKRAFGFLGINLDDYIDIDVDEVTGKMKKKIKQAEADLQDTSRSDPIMMDVQPVLNSSDPTMVDSWDTTMIENKASSAAWDGFVSGVTSIGADALTSFGNTLTNVTKVGTGNGFTEWLNSYQPRESDTKPIEDTVNKAFSQGIEKGLVIPDGVTMILSDELESTIEDGVVKGVINGAATWKQDGRTITYFDDAGEQIAEILYNSVMEADSAASQLGDSLTAAIGAAGTDGGWQLSANIKPSIKFTADDVRQRLENKLAGAGTSGGRQLADNTSAEVERKTWGIKELLANNLGSAGESAGSSIASGIQGVLSAFTFGINIIGTIASIFGGGQSQQYAKAMSPGYILNGATVFGFSRSGQPLVGGESGPEAVIGTRSLHDLITDAVQTGRGGDSIQVNIYQQPGESAEVLADKVERVLVRRERQRRASYA